MGTKRRFLVLAMALLALWATGVQALVEYVPWDPGVYVGWNELIVQGTLTRLAGDSRQLPQHENFSFGGQAGTVRVIRVMCNRTDLAVACGDSICFFNRIESRSAPKNGTFSIVSDPGTPIDIPVGTSGYFAFEVNRYGISPGWHFYLGVKRRREVDAFMASLAADSAATVRALERRSPGHVFRFCPIGGK